MKILIDKPKNAFDSFELISEALKASPMNPMPMEDKGADLPAEQLEKQLGWAKECEAMLKVPEEPPEDSGVVIPQLFPEDRQALSWAGVSFGKGELYRLFLSIKKLAEGLPADTTKIRLFGKITTKSLPYYVVEGLTAEEEEGIDETKQEGKGGANKYSYWVSQNIEGGKWTKLPSVTMAQIVVARKTKKFLTGDLEATVSVYPPFDGVEKNLLRAQIARIAGATSIAPDGYFVASEDEPPVAQPAEAEPFNEACVSRSMFKSSTELRDASAWKHYEQGFNKLGRIQPMPEVLGEDGEPILPDEPVECFPILCPLKAQDWSFRVGPGGAGANAESIVVARSLRWPGASALAYHKKFLNIYVGNGIANDNVKRPQENPSYMSFTPYTVPMPAMIEGEWTADGTALTEEADTLEDPTPPPPPEEEEEG